MKKILTLALAALFCSAAELKAQINLNDSIRYITASNEEYASIINYMQKAMRFNHEVPQEKVYLHLDNTGYFNGEDIWFKAYVVRADDQKTTQISSVLYVELVTPGGRVVKTKKLHIYEGEAHGNIKLDDIFESGFFEIRAYTRYMTNWGNAAIFSRVIPIFEKPIAEGNYTMPKIATRSYRERLPQYRNINNELLDNSSEKKIKGNEDLTTAKVISKGKINVSFFPEGGNIVEDVPCRVAFSVIDSDGKHFDTEGRILNSNKEIIGGAVTYDNGRGYFDVTSDGTPLYLQLTSADGKTHEFELPEAVQEGVGLMMNTLKDDEITADLRSSASLENTLFGYVLMHNGKIYHADTLTCKEHLSIKFDRKNIPAGVNQFTLIDSDGRIQAERLFFICPPADKADSIHITTQQKVIQPCGKVKLDIQTRPNASISLSAMDVATMTNGMEGNAKTWMLLSSEVKGYIEHPDYYFEADDREHRQSADMLMMIQGWRRYSWTLMEGLDEFKNIQNIEDSLYVHGQVLDRLGNNTMEGVDLTLYIWNSQGDWLKGNTTTGENGFYAFTLPNMTGDWKMVFVTKANDKKKNMRVTVNRNFSPMTRWLSPYETEYMVPLNENFLKDTPDSLYRELDDMPIRKRDHVLPTVKVKAKRRIYDFARDSWETEDIGKHWADLYFNMTEETEKILDEGEDIPTIDEWLYTHIPDMEALAVNRKFKAQEESNIQEKSKETLRKEEEYYNNLQEADEIEFSAFEKMIDDKDNTSGMKSGNSKKLASEMNEIIKTHHEKNNDVKFYSDLKYRGHQILKIIDNNSSVIRIMPHFVDEVNAIYLSMNSRAHNRWNMPNGAIAHIYTHIEHIKKIKGHVNRRFHAFDKVETFHMDDYSVLPPMEDFRRTIFWEPEIKTDANGKAHVEFYNNSSARKLYISAEGITKDGHVLVNE